MQCESWPNVQSCNKLAAEFLLRAALSDPSMVAVVSGIAVRDVKKSASSSRARSDQRQAAKGRAQRYAHY